MSDSFLNKSYYLWTIGCQMNVADSRRLSSQLEALGYTSSEAAENADILVVNTCVIRQQVEDKILGRLGSFKTVKERRPDTVIAVMGCMVGRHETPFLRERFPYVDVFMAPSDTDPLIDYLAENELYDGTLIGDAQDRALRDAVQNAANLLPADERGHAVTAYVPVVLGCSHACSFCIIPYRRGIERSRPRREILDEIRGYVDQGVREVMLLGQIVDRYGKDLGPDEDLARLLHDVHRIDGMERIRFLTSHPNWMDDDLLRAVRDLERVCPQLEIPIQAANNEVLERMRRGYTREEYLSLIDRVRTLIPEAAIHTDIIVGFCGESHDQFMDTYRLMEQVRFDKAHISKYSVRPRTVAARRMEDDVSPEEKEERRKMLDDLQRDILTEKARHYKGQEVEVLVESMQRERWHGRTPHNKIVFFDDERTSLQGQLVKVKVDWTGPYSLVGRGTFTTDCEAALPAQAQLPTA